MNIPCGSSPQPLGWCSRNPQRRLAVFHEPRHWAKLLSAMHCDPSFLKPLGPSCLKLFYHQFYFYGRNLIICFPQARSSESLETVLEIKNKHPKLTSPQGYVLASGWLGGKSPSSEGKQNIPQHYLAACQSHYKQIPVTWMSSGCVVSWGSGKGISRFRLGRYFSTLDLLSGFTWWSLCRWLIICENLSARNGVSWQILVNTEAKTALVFR